MDSLGFPEHVREIIREKWRVVSEAARLELQESKFSAHREVLDMLVGFPGVPIVEGGEGVHVKPVEAEDPDQPPYPDIPDVEVKLRFATGRTPVPEISVHLGTMEEVEAYRTELQRALHLERVYVEVNDGQVPAPEVLGPALERVVVTNMLVCTSPFDFIYTERMGKLRAVLESHLGGVVGGAPVMRRLNELIEKVHRYNTRWFFLYDFDRIPGLAQAHQDLAAHLVYYEKLYEGFARLDVSEYPRELDSEGLLITDIAIDFDFDVDKVLDHCGDLSVNEARTVWMEELRGEMGKRTSTAALIASSYPFLPTAEPSEEGSLSEESI